MCCACLLLKVTVVTKESDLRSGSLAAGPAGLCQPHTQKTNTGLTTVLPCGCQFRICWFSLCRYTMPCVCCMTLHACYLNLSGAWVHELCMTLACCVHSGTLFIVIAILMCHVYSITIFLIILSGMIAIGTLCCASNLPCCCVVPKSSALLESLQLEEGAEECKRIYASNQKYFNFLD